MALRAKPEPGAEQADQMLFGEVFDVLDEIDGFAWGQARRDGYVGFVDRGALTPEPAEPSHWVAVRSTWAFSEPSVRARPFGPLSLNALVSAEAEEGAFIKLRDAGWVPAAHLRKIGESLDDVAGAAQLFVGAPYLWGGRDASGLDCSGLVQQALAACGRAAPRDADQQARLGTAVEPQALQSGDLVAWKGHIGLMLDEERLIHANAHHMAVAVEPLSAALERIAAGGAGAPIAWRRFRPGAS